MSKSVKYNLEYLNRLVNNVNGNNKSKAESLIQLYADRKFSQVTSAEKQIKHFIGYGDAKDRQKNKYDKNINKYQDVKPLGERLKDNKYVEPAESLVGIKH